MWREPGLWRVRVELEGPEQGEGRVVSGAVPGLGLAPDEESR